MQLIAKVDQATMALGERHPHSAEAATRSGATAAN